MRLPRGSVIAGRVVDENGDPAFGVACGSLIALVNGERTFTMPTIGTANDTTDDRGTFRMCGLPAGEYVVIATPRATTGEIKAMTEDEIRAVMQALQQQAARAAAQTRRRQWSVTARHRPRQRPHQSRTRTRSRSRMPVYGRRRRRRRQR